MQFASKMQTEIFSATFQHHRKNYAHKNRSLPQKNFTYKLSTNGTINRHIDTKRTFFVLFFQRNITFLNLNVCSKTLS